MTEHDKQLIIKAEKISRWNYRDVDTLIASADTTEARQRLIAIKYELYDLMHESL